MNSFQADENTGHDAADQAHSALNHISSLLKRPRHICAAAYSSHLVVPPRLCLASELFSPAMMLFHTPPPTLALSRLRVASAPRHLVSSFSLLPSRVVLLLSSHFNLLFVHPPPCRVWCMWCMWCMSCLAVAALEKV